MSKIQVEAVTRQRYNGIWYLPGESFEVDTESEVADMEASHPPLVKRVKRSYENRTMVPAPDSNEQKTPQVVTGKSQKYERRDMRAR